MPELHELEVATRLRYWREKAGLRNRDIFRALGVSKSTVSSWESGKANPSHEDLARFAKLCGTNIADFWAVPVIAVPARKARRG